MASSIFMDASRLMTGQHEFVPRLADLYEAHFLGQAGAAAFLQACQAALSTADPERSIKATMAGDAAMAAGGKELVHLWFVGAPGPADGKDQDYLTEETYFGALLWPVIGAHPPGLSGGYFGHWRYLPDE